MFKRSLCLLLLLAVPLPLRAADDDKAPLLTPKEIADGWLALFDGESLFGWKAADGAKWSVVNGMLYAEAGSTGPLVTTSAFADYELIAEYRAKDEGKPQLVVGCAADGKGGGNTAFDTLSSNGWCRLRLVAVGSGVQEAEWRSIGGLGGVARGMKSDRPLPAGNSGHLALAGSSIVIRQLKLRPMNLKPAFNGKDLSGWKEHPGKKSKFSVTEDGCIRLENGPGDLQTEDQWADFVLQIDCRTNGDFLNSGVFFRCIPGEYQQGYEAQIHNKFDREPTKEYSLEEYDPKTHELAATKKVKYAATDYGTGAIYRRMPARKQVAKDREWFTMTIVADGPHLAVWVNGYPVTDWTDNRPRKDNARNGCRLEKGPISLQGHDGTTDLLFRNIRIAALPGPEEKK